MKRFFQKIKNLYHLLVAIIANLCYGFPSRRLKVIGVTGTDGKTTTVHLIYHLLKSVEKKASMVSSVCAKIGSKEYDTGFHVTTPNPFALQKLLRQSADFGDQYFVLEVTSHALDQHRVWGINFEVAVITNVTNEHLDYHLNYEDYVITKVKLLKMAKISLVNKDDKSYQYIKKQISNIKKTYQISKIIKAIPHFIKFNQYNYSAALAVCQELGLSEDEILKGMKSFKLPEGRLEIVYDKDFTVMIDFAHTPNALKNLLQELRKNYLKVGGRLIHVFGSAGLRDNFKRPLMGQISADYADLIILTEEDYRVEDPHKICRQIAMGIKNKNYSIIIDRQEAIQKAINLARVNDLVVITGKGHEKSLCRGKKEFSWSDHQAVSKALKQKVD